MLARTPPLVCRQMVELITDYLEGALPRSQRQRFEAHIAGCEHCGEYLAQVRSHDQADRPAGAPRISRRR